MRLQGDPERRLFVTCRRSTAQTASISISISISIDLRPRSRGWDPWWDPKPPSRRRPWECQLSSAVSILGSNSVDARVSVHVQPEWRMHGWRAANPHTFPSGAVVRCSLAARRRCRSGEWRETREIWPMGGNTMTGHSMAGWPWFLAV